MGFSLVCFIMRSVKHSIHNNKVISVFCRIFWMIDVLIEDIWFYLSNLEVETSNLKVLDGSLNFLNVSKTATSCWLDFFIINLLFVHMVIKSPYYYFGLHSRNPSLNIRYMFFNFLTYHLLICICTFCLLHLILTS